MKKLLFLLTTFILATFVITACGDGEAENNNANSNDDSEALSEESLKVGVTAGPHEEFFDIVKDLAAEDGLEIELVTFSDYVMPNTALAEGEIDMNSYQHEPFLIEYNEDRSEERRVGKE